MKYKYDVEQCAPYRSDLKTTLDKISSNGGRVVFVTQTTNSKMSGGIKPAYDLLIIAETEA